MNEVEAKLVGTALASNGAAIDDAPVTEADFHSPKLGALWQLMCSMRSKGEPVDVVAVASRLNQLDTPVTAVELHELLAMGGSAASAEFYAARVIEAATRSRLGAAARKVIDLAASPADVADVIDQARRAIDDAAGVGRADARPMAETITRTLDLLTEPARHAPTPWEDLNHLIGGWRPGALYVIGARPGVGKTVVGLEAALHMTGEGRALYCSLEMPEPELHMRAIASIANVSTRDLERRTISSAAWENIRDAMPRLTRDLWVDDRSAVTPGTIRQQARTLKRKGGLSGIVVDYLQLMASPRGDRRPRHEVVADFSRQLKLLAKDLDVPVIALSQLNRNSEARQDKTPQISDLRESGAVEQDADVVILLHRDLEKAPDAMHLVIAKNRHGITGHVQLAFDGAHARLKPYHWTPYGRETA